MRKIIYPLALFLALATFGGINAQQVITETVTVADNIVSKRQNINRPITQLIVEGKSAVQLVYDTTNFIVVSFSENEANPLDERWVIVKGMTLAINDPEGWSIYEVHLKKSDLKIIKNNIKTQILYTSAPYLDLDTDSITLSPLTTGNLARNQQLDEARHQLDEARHQLIEARKELSKALVKKHGERVETYTYTVNDSIDSTSDFIPLEPIEVIESNEVIETVVDDDTTVTRKPRPKKYHYNFEDRTGGALLWGFNNWGSEWYNGLNKMGGAYELRTSFSSWQLELSYAVIMTRHFYLDIGIGYESDIYKFSTPIIDIDENGILQDRNTVYLNSNYSNYTAVNQAFEGTRLDDWSSRLVTRYLSLPVEMVVRFGDDFKIGLAAIPALALSSSHTGLKHEIETRDLEYQDVENISKFITPYKLDLRLSMRYEHFGVFAQVATTSLFTDKDVYPIKIGLIIK